MKILFFINHLANGGAEHIASILMNHLCLKHNVTLVVFSNEKESFPTDSRITIRKININHKRKILRSFEHMIKINKEIKQNSPDLIISFLTHTNLYTLTANLPIGRKIIVSERNTLNRQSPFVRLLRKILYPVADKIVFVSNFDYKKFNLPQKSLTIYNPSMFEPFADYSNRQKNIITIAPTNRWYNKGLDLLLKAWGTISDKNPDWNLQILGSINNQIIPDELSVFLSERVEWLGWNKNVSEILRTKSIFVLASRFEGCPNSLIEAMSQGCACMGTDCEGGMNEIITNGVDGLIARSGNSDDIAAKLQLLIDDDNLRQRLSANAIEKVKLFDKNTFWEKWDKTINEVTKK